jgi:hypothetical protein
MMGKADREILEQEDADRLTTIKREVLRTGEPARVETSVQNLRGEDEFFEGAYIPRFDSAGRANGLIGYFRNVTERVRAERALGRTNRALRLLSESNQALIRAANEASLLNAICRNAVETGGYRLAWVGLAGHDDAKSVRPVAQYGFEEGYLETLDITCADTEHGRGPTGTAIRTGEAVVARNILNDPQFAPWREQALKRGYAVARELRRDPSLDAVPIRQSAIENRGGGGR